MINFGKLGKDRKTIKVVFLFSYIMGSSANSIRNSKYIVGIPEFPWFLRQPILINRNKCFHHYILSTPGGLIIGFIFGIITALITKATSEIRVLGNHF